MRLMPHTMVAGKCYLPGNLGFTKDIFLVSAINSNAYLCNYLWYLIPHILLDSSTSHLQEQYKGDCIQISLLSISVLLDTFGCSSPFSTESQAGNKRDPKLTAYICYTPVERANFKEKPYCTF